MRLKADWPSVWKTDLEDGMISCTYIIPSLVPRPPPRLYLAAVENFSPRLRDKVWAEAWERGYIIPSVVEKSALELD